MEILALAFLIVASILFAIDAAKSYELISLGLAFLAAALALQIILV